MRLQQAKSCMCLALTLLLAMLSFSRCSALALFGTCVLVSAEQGVLGWLRLIGHL